MEPQIPPNRQITDIARNALYLFLAFCLVLIVLASPISAEMTGRSHDRMELEQAQRDLKDANAEIKRLRERLDEELNRSAAAIDRIDHGLVEIRAQFRNVEWLRQWIQSGTKVRR